MSAIAMVIILTVGIVEIFGFTAAIYIMTRKLEELRLEREKYNTGIFQTLSTFLDRLKKKDGQQMTIVNEISKQYDILREQYETLDKAYEHMNTRYMEICEHYSKLLTCWAGVEERYSDCYEQLKYQNERFDKIEKFIDEWNQNIWHPEEDIDMDISHLVAGEPCEYNYAGECQNEDCPALNMYCTTIDPRNCRYSNLAYDPIGDDEK